MPRPPSATAAASVMTVKTHACPCIYLEYHAADSSLAVPCVFLATRCNPHPSSRHVLWPIPRITSKLAPPGVTIEWPNEPSQQSAPRHLTGCLRECSTRGYCVNAERATPTRAAAAVKMKMPTIAIGHACPKPIDLVLPCAGGGSCIVDFS